MVKKLLLGVFCVAVALVLACGCAGSKAQKVVVLNIAAQNSGFILAQKASKLAEEVLKVSQNTLGVGIDKFTQSTFHDWAGAVMEELGLDPFLVMNFKELVKLIDIEITLAENQQEIIQLTYGAIQNFVIGINAGKK